MLRVAQTETVRATEVHVFAKLQYDRIERLVERGVTSVTQLEEAHQKLAVAAAALDAAEALVLQAGSGVERAKAALVEATQPGGPETCCVPILSPADGVVLDIDVISARPVIAGERLLTVGDPGEIELVADLLSTDAVRLPENARASVERWGGPPLEARLAYVEPAGRTKISALGIEEQRVDAVFDILSPPEDRAALGHDFAVFLRIVEVEEEDVLLTPLSSAFRVGQGWAVFRARGDRVEQVPVELGPQNGRFAVVLSGLEEGDRVVEHPREDLTDGALFVERTSF